MKLIISSLLRRHISFGLGLVCCMSIIVLKYCKRITVHTVGLEVCWTYDLLDFSSTWGGYWQSVHCRCFVSGGIEWFKTFSSISYSPPILPSVLRAEIWVGWIFVVWLIKFRSGVALRTNLFTLWFFRTNIRNSISFVFGNSIIFIVGRVLWLDRSVYQANP